MATSQSLSGTPYRERGQNTRKRIYQEAMRLFEARGFRGTSMNDIAAACNVTKPALYYHFSNKSHLLEKLYEDVTGDFYCQIRSIAAADGDADKNMRLLVRTQVLYNIKNRHFLRVFWSERDELQGEPRQALAALEREFEETVSSLVKFGQKQGLFRAGSAKLLTYSTLGLLSTVHRWSHYTDCDPENIAEQVANLLCSGLALPDVDSESKSDFRVPTQEFKVDD